VEVVEGGATPRPLIQDKPKRLDNRRLTSVIFSEQDVHARREIDNLVYEAPIVLDTNRCQVHDVLYDAIVAHRLSGVLESPEIRPDNRQCSREGFWFCPKSPMHVLTLDQ
jgi:hypothetical protein